MMGKTRSELNNLVGGVYKYLRVAVPPPHHHYHHRTRTAFRLVSFNFNPVLTTAFLDSDKFVFQKYYLCYCVQPSKLAIFIRQFIALIITANNVFHGHYYFSWSSTFECITNDDTHFSHFFLQLLTKLKVCGNLNDLNFYRPQPYN